MDLDAIVQDIDAEIGRLEKARAIRAQAPEVHRARVT
jgi:hypothetical protein